MINLFVQGRTKSLHHHTVQVRLNKSQFVLGICRARKTMRWDLFGCFGPYVQEKTAKEET
jgi:hypothetical protein